MTTNDWIIAGALALVGLLAIAATAPLAVFWLRARLAGLPLQMIELVGMRLRRVRIAPVVDAAIQARRAGVPVELTQVETHSLAGGDPRAVVAALIEGRAKGMPLTWNEAAECDLAGRDALGAVRRGVHPRVGVVDNFPRTRP